MMLPEELTALRLMDTAGIQKVIDEKKNLLDMMVGTLYPSILAEEIAQIQEIYMEKVERE